PFANGALGNRNAERDLVMANDRVSLVVQTLERRIVDPDIHGKFKLANQTRAADEGGDAPLDAIVRRALRQRRPVRTAPAYHLPPLHVLRGVAGVQASDVGADRAAIAVRVGLLVEKVVGPLKISAE